MSNFPAIWYTSNTPLSIGQRECAYARWAGYHAGKHGTGYRRSATAVPLATGAGVHDGVGLIGQWILDWQHAYPGQRRVDVPVEVIAWAATEAAAKYEHKARAKGLELTKTDLPDADAINTLILEQRTLIEAQVWMYALARLPVMLSQAVLVSVEHEEGPVLDCTCGLGNWVGQVTDHAARGCRGICAQGRADFIWRLVDSGAYVYEELKTKATQNYGWEQQWEHSGQLWLNMEAAGKRLGVEIETAYVPVLFKGRRDRTDREDKTSPKIQQSPLVYGYYDPGNGMTRLPEWSARYKWCDEWGKWHTLPRTYQRTAIWRDDVDLPSDSSNPNGVQFAGPMTTRVERWVRGWILPAQYADLVRVLGPFPRPPALMADAERALLTEERRWRADVEWLRANGVFEPGDVTAEGITAADVITRSWNCTSFDGTPCPYRRACYREPGWESFAGADGFEIRTPHHALEKAAATAHIAALGLEWPESDDDGDGE